MKMLQFPVGRDQGRERACFLWAVEDLVSSKEDVFNRQGPRRGEHEGFALKTTS